MDVGNSVDESDCSVSVRIFSEDEQELSEAAIVIPLSTTRSQLQVN